MIKAKPEITIALTKDMKLRVSERYSLTSRDLAATPSHIPPCEWKPELDKLHGCVARLLELKYEMTEPYEDEYNEYPPVLESTIIRYSRTTEAGEIVGNAGWYSLRQGEPVYELEI